MPFRTATMLLCGLGMLGCSPGGYGDNASNALGAGITAAIAAGTWVAAGGCRLQGCPWGTYCDDSQELCVRAACGDGCPTGSYCNEQIDRCEDMPSVTVMNPPQQPPEADQTLQRPVTAPIPF